MRVLAQEMYGEAIGTVLVLLLRHESRFSAPISPSTSNILKMTWPPGGFKMEGAWIHEGAWGEKLSSNQNSGIGL